jgi:hypothetical protein
MKSLMLFLRELITDCGERCRVSTSHDVKTIMAREEHEGMQFLTVTLPAFGKDFERSLDLGQVAHAAFPGFARRRGLPLFLGGFLELVFDRDTGRLVDNPSIDAIRSVRQITLAFGKLKALPSERKVAKAMKGYVDCEKEVAENVNLFVSPENREVREAFQRIGSLIWADFFSVVSNEIYNEGIKPKHGPGATADRLVGNHKFDQLEWTDRLEEYFPFGNTVLPNWRAFLERSPAVNFLEPGTERPSRVTAVPKTMKTPRLIAIEPTCMQYVQQGILSVMKRKVEEDDLLYSLAGWDSQTPNQEFARLGSISGALATLDLSEASDRVSLQHVRDLLRNHRFLLGAVEACRTTKADVPGFGVIPLAKFASMGSALCFPFEIVVFVTAIFVGIEQALNRRLVWHDVKSLSNQVRVFGDDIIVPSDYAQYVVTAMHSLGFIVNVSKSFWTGRFRESCGKEYYGGHDVCVTRVRNEFPARRKDTEQIISTVSLRNQLFKAGYVRSVDFLDDLIERFIPFPVVEETSAILGKLSYGPYQPTGWHPHLHIPLVRGCVVKPQKAKRKLDSWGALMKWFLKDSELPFIDRDHLLYSGRPVSVDIKTRMASPF